MTSGLRRVGLAALSDAPPVGVAVFDPTPVLSDLAIARALEAGAAGYIVRPFSPS